MSVNRFSHALKYCNDKVAKRNSGLVSIYFLVCGDYVKVGYASNLKSRFSSFKMHNPYPVKFIHTTQFMPVKCAKLVEKTIFECFHLSHHHGEWYRLDEFDILSAKVEVQSVYEQYTD